MEPKIKVNSVLIPEYKLCRVLHFNIRSLKCHYDELLLFLSSLKVKPTVIALTETWLNDLDHIDSMSFAGFSKLITKNRGTRGGGIGLLVSECASTAIEDSAGEAMETLKVSITYENIKFGILIIYRPPNSKAADFVEEFDSLMESVAGSNRDWIILGDFNIDILQPSALSKSYLNVISSHNFQQVIQIPTRVTNNSSSLLDHISTNIHSSKIKNSGIIESSITDHFPVFVDLVVNSKKHPTSFEYRKLSDIEKNQKRFREFVCEHIDNLDRVNFESITCTIHNAVNIFAPRRLFKRKSEQSSPWITNSLKNLMSKRNRIRKQVTQYPTSRILAEKYKYIKNRVIRSIRSAKRKYYATQIEKSMENPKTFFDTLNLVIGKNIKPSIPTTISVNGNFVENDVDIASVFNEFFAGIGPQLLKAIDHRKPVALDDVDFSMAFKPVTSGEVEEIINSLRVNTSSGVDDIPTVVIKILGNVLSGPLVNLINEHIRSGIFPAEFKCAKVVPIHKNGGKDNPNNYRPISLLPSLSKIFERVLYNRLFDYFTYFNLFFCNQFGFRPKKSTVDALVHITETIRHDLTHGCKLPAAVFLDLKKAFDTVDHSILIKKLESYGIRGYLLSCLSSYLEKRSQIVKVRSSISAALPLNCGVPQGSVLGPLLFIIYINDLHQVCQNSKVFHFADDTSVLFDMRNNDDNSVNCELQIINEWMKSNKLTLNQNKTEVMLFENHIDCYLNSETLLSVSSVKYLGVIVDKDLKYKSHINSLHCSISRLVGLTYSMRKFLNKQNLLKFYNVYIKPKMQYGILVYGCTSKSELNVLKRLQNKFLRSICFLRKFDRVDHLFELHRILPIHKLYIYDLLKFALRSYNNLLDDEFLNNLICHRQYSRNLRSSSVHIISTPKVKGQLSKLSIAYRGAKLLNSIHQLGLYDLNFSCNNQIQHFVHYFRDNVLLYDNEIIDIVFA